jgi:hypothetical protein
MKYLLQEGEELKRQTLRTEERKKQMDRQLEPAILTKVQTLKAVRGQSDRVISLALTVKSSLKTFTKMVEVI